MKNFPIAIALLLLTTTSGCVPLRTIETKEYIHECKGYSDQTSKSLKAVPICSSGSGGAGCAIQTLIFTPLAMFVNIFTTTEVLYDRTIHAFDEKKCSSPMPQSLPEQEAKAGRQ